MRFNKAKCCICNLEYAYGQEEEYTENSSVEKEGPDIQKAGLMPAVCICSLEDYQGYINRGVAAGRGLSPSALLL